MRSSPVLMWATCSARLRPTPSLGAPARSSTRTTAAWPRCGWTSSKTSSTSYHQVGLFLWSADVEYYCTCSFKSFYMQLCIHLHCVYNKTAARLAVARLSIQYVCVSLYIYSVVVSRSFWMKGKGLYSCSLLSAVRKNSTRARTFWYNTDQICEQPANTN